MSIIRMVSNKLKLAVGCLIPRYPPTLLPGGYLPGLRSTLKEIKKSVSSSNNIKVELDLSQVKIHKSKIKERLGLRIGNITLSEDIHQSLAEEMLINFQHAITITKETTIKDIKNILFNFRKTDPDIEIETIKDDFFKAIEFANCILDKISIRAFYSTLALFAASLILSWIPIFFPTETKTIGLITIKYNPLSTPLALCSFVVSFIKGYYEFKGIKSRQKHFREIGD